MLKINEHLPHDQKIITIDCLKCGRQMFFSKDVYYNIKEGQCPKCKTFYRTRSK